MQLAFSEARKQARAASSSGVPNSLQGNILLHLFYGFFMWCCLQDDSINSSDKVLDYCSCYFVNLFFIRCRMGFTFIAVSNGAHIFS